MYGIPDAVQCIPLIGKEKDNSDPEEENSELLFDKNNTLDKVRNNIEMLEAVHFKGMGHPGIDTTYQRLGQYFPEHSISHKFVLDFVAKCPTCQKNSHRHDRILSTSGKTFA
jgi:hypothetical protein